MAVEALAAARRPDRLLVVAAHPGEAELELGGAIARWTAEGTVAHLACCTSGDVGGPDAATDPLALSATREREQRAAAELIGFEAVTFLHRPQGALVNDLALREQLTRLMRQLRPDAVAAPDPRPRFVPGGVNHRDRRAAGGAAVDTASSDVAEAMAFAHLSLHEDLPPHRVERLLLYATDRPTVAVDIGAWLERKLAALAEHASGDAGRLAERARAFARRDGQRAGLELAEALAEVGLG